MEKRTKYFLSLGKEERKPKQYRQKVSIHPGRQGEALHPAGNSGESKCAGGVQKRRVRLTTVSPLLQIFNSKKKKTKPIAWQSKKKAICTARRETAICTVKREKAERTAKREKAVCTAKQEKAICTAEHKNNPTPYRARKNKKQTKNIVCHEYGEMPRNTVCKEDGKMPIKNRTKGKGTETGMRSPKAEPSARKGLFKPSVN